MAKSKKAAAQYESGTLAAFAVAGILLIALGVVSLLAVVGGLKGTLFTMVKRVMQGLGGGLCLGVSVLLIWAGVLVAFSSGRSMPKRGFLLFTLLFFSVLGIIDLVSRVGQDTLPAYLVKYNNQAAPSSATWPRCRTCSSRARRAAANPCASTPSSTPSSSAPRRRRCA